MNYYIEPFGKKKLKGLLRKINIKPEALSRKKEATYRELNLSNRMLVEKELINIMLENPGLVQRPIVEAGPKAVLARHVERVNEIL